MKQRINGIAIDLRKLTEYELSALIRMTNERIEAAEHDRQLLANEQVRRADNVHQLRFEYEGPAVG